MITSFFPLKKLRRSGKWLLFVAVLVFGAFAVYQEFARTATTTHTRGNSAHEGSIWRRPASEQGAGGDYQPDSGEDSASWRSSYTPQAWKPEFKGQANLHVFEDWCGSSTAQLRNNLHYPLYPHSRTTVQKLAVSPQWTNYGLRIFGYLHPYTDGEFVFAVSSDDNSEFWLSGDDSPLNLQLLSWVGKAGTEWTAPGEFEKYASQTSTPIWLSAQKRYFFEVILKQNDRGTDHVAVAWHLKHDGLKFMVIESKHISLYTNETALLMSDVAHIPQTAASHTSTLGGPLGVEADMLKDDPRDTFFHVPFIKNKYLQGVLPDCSYNPSYIIKGFPLMRYQGLQFVHMSYIYPNDYTRLTHMETENSCFYHESPYYLERYGFSRYLRLDRPERSEREDRAVDFGFQRNDMLEEEEEGEVVPRGGAAKPRPALDDGNLQDYGDDYDDYIQNRKRKLFSLGEQEAGGALKNTSNTRSRKRKKGRGISLKRGDVSELRLETKASAVVTSVPNRLREQNGREPVLEKQVLPAVQIKQPAARRPVKSRKVRQGNVRPKQRNSGPPVEKERPRPEVGGQARAEESPADLSQQPQVHSEQTHTQKPVQGSEDNQVQRPKDVQSQVPEQVDSFPDKGTVNRRRSHMNRTVELRPAVTRNSTSTPTLQPNRQEEVNRMSLRELEMQLNVPLPLERDNAIHKARMTTKDRVVAREWLDTGGEEEEEEESDRKGEAKKERNGREDEKDAAWDTGRETEGGDDEEMENYEMSPPPVFDPTVNWKQTFHVNHLDLQSMRSDWIDLRCNVSGNLMLPSSEVQPLVNDFMEKLNHKHHGRFSLVRVINVEKRADAVQGNRYLLELELKDLNGQLLRLSRYIYVLVRRKRQRSREFMIKHSVPETVLCNPVGLHWNPVATVHFIVPVKNQARWVKQLIVDMETLYRETGDANFNLIITDYNSTDMDVEKALQASTLPRHQYVKLSGNFERSAGLQAGINLITEDHSIVFLCDLHIHFPPSIIDTIRKHCVEGRMAFAPIVMRLDCGATPRQPRGYWEVNGFGLLGLYKTDLDAAGGMNTREFTDRWGGEDWELLDRLLQSGLEVERIFLRNFFHHYHSKRGMWNRRTQSDTDSR